MQTRYALVIAMLALAFTSASCAASPPKTEVLGVVEVDGATSEVGLIEAVCITNTPTREPC